MQIGVFGGSFNPIHRCHLHVAEHACQRLSLDRVMFIPIGDPPHKPSHSLASAHHRLEMVHLAINGYTNFCVNDIESRSQDTSYTFHTLQQLKQTEIPCSTFFFLVGLDAFLEFPTWKYADQLLAMSNFVILSRPGVRFSDLVSLPLLPHIPSSTLENLDKGEQHRHDIPISTTTRIILLAVPPCSISASDIRHRLTLDQPLSHCLPSSVESYILQNKVYENLKG